MPELTSGVLIAVMTVISIVIFGVLLFFAMNYWQRRRRGRTNAVIAPQLDCTIKPSAMKRTNPHPDSAARASI